MKQSDRDLIIRRAVEAGLFSAARQRGEDAVKNAIGSVVRLAVQRFQDRVDDAAVDEMVALALEEVSVQVSPAGCVVDNTTPPSLQLEPEEIPNPSPGESLSSPPGSSAPGRYRRYVSDGLHFLSATSDDGSRWYISAILPRAVAQRLFTDTEACLADESEDAAREEA